MSALVCARPCTPAEFRERHRSMHVRVPVVEVEALLACGWHLVVDEDDVLDASIALLRAPRVLMVRDADPSGRRFAPPQGSAPHHEGPLFAASPQLPHPEERPQGASRRTP